MSQRTMRLCMCVCVCGNVLYYSSPLHNELFLGSIPQSVLNVVVLASALNETKDNVQTALRDLFMLIGAKAAR